MSRGLVAEPITLPLNGRLSVRLYPDSRPSNLEISGLHKGLVLVADGEELVEEGAGFGVPVARYRDKTYFPGSSRIEVLSSDTPVVRKTYHLDMVSRKSLGGRRISDSLYRPLHAAFHAAYVSIPRFRPILNGVMRLREDAGLETSFERRKSRGEVPVTYTISPTEIAVAVDLASLETDGLVEVAVLNEQGARFCSYSDSNGLTLQGNQIGGWDVVAASECRLCDPTKDVLFALRSVEGTCLRRGREAVRRRFSWAGLNYTLPPPLKMFRYRVILRESQRFEGDQKPL